MRRLFALVAMAVVFAGAVAVAVVIATSTSSNVVHLRQIVANDAQGAINQVRDFINKYTK
jgi:hypothetical protein